MERNPQQQKQGAARCLSIFTFMIPDPYSPSTVHQPLFTDHCSWIPVNDHCSLWTQPTPYAVFGRFFVSLFRVRHLVSIGYLFFLLIIQ